MARRDYVHAAPEGGGVVIHWDSESCIHSGECVRLLPEVFRAKKRPWVDPDGAEADAIITTVAACPTSALEYSVFAADEEAPVRVDVDDDGAHEDAPGSAPVSVTVLAKGPYLLSGPLEILDAEGNVARTVTNAALCRCGHSATKPFCDGSHHKQRFDDPGAVAPPS